ncbi:MAG: MATE family efflux transporter [Prevotella sp.]|jgi:MATE family multidrug resistance protein
MTLLRFPAVSHYTALIKLGMPIIVGQIGTIVLGFADTLMIGRYGTNELASASFVNNMFMLVLVFSLGFSYGLTPLVGSSYGKGETDRIGTLLKNGIAANLVLMFGLMLLMTLLYFNLNHLGQPDALLPLIRPYFLVNLASLPFVALFNVFKQTADGVMRTRAGMWIMLAANLLNIVGNYVLIYGVWGFPELGLLGAGISTLFARIVMAVSFGVLFFFSRGYAPYRKAFHRGRLSLPIISNLTRMGLPLGMQIGMETCAFSLTAIIVGWIGITSLAANQIILICSQFCYYISSGMASAVGIRVSYYHGQKRWDDLNDSVIAGFQLVLLLNVITSTLIFSIRNHVGYWFNDSPEVATLVATCVLPLVVYQFGDGMQCTYANALRGLGRVKILVPVAFLAYFVICLPLGYLLAIPLGIGLPGIWWAYPFGLTTAGIFFYISFKKATRRA